MFATFFVTVIMVGLVCPQTACAQQVSESQWKRGFHGFNIICKNAGLIHESISKWMTVPDSQRVLVVLGDVRNVPLNIDNFIDRGGAVLIATDGSSSRVIRRQGIGFSSADVHASFKGDFFENFPDCPIVTDIRIHPSLENVNSIVTNRPGLLTPTERVPNSLKVIAYLPSLVGSFHSNRFIATAERQNGGRLMCVADQSVFCNQMLIHHDNAIFAQQAINWLKNESRTHLLVLADGKVESAIDPSGVEVMLPPPSRKEVLNALKNLPPSAMLEFGNAVATVVEDENMVNEFIHSSVDQVRPVVLRRALILISFTLICAVSLFTFIWQKKLMRQTASEIAFKDSRKVNKIRKTNALNRSRQRARQRQRAAGLLMHSFCWEVARRHYDDWPTFPDGLINESVYEPVNESGDESIDESLGSTNEIIASLRHADNQFKKNKPAYWTTQRLEKLEQDIATWKRFFRSHPLAAQALDLDADVDPINLSTKH